VTPAARQAGRFVLLGGANTLGTGLLLIALARVMDPRIAFSLAFATGLVVGTVTTGRVVFATRATRRQMLAYAAWYLLVYLVGLGVLQLLGARTGSPRAGLTVLVTAPLGFFGGRWIFGSPPDGTPPD
jgi:putative flippase GtrA